MITLDCSINPSSDIDKNWESIPEWNLRYDYFLGDIQFEADDANFSAPWGWVTVLDFGLCLCALLDALEPGGEQIFEFTESDARITFRRSDDVVDLTANYSPDAASVKYDELVNVCQSFTENLVKRLCREHPGLEKNVELLEALKKIGIASNS